MDFGGHIFRQTNSSKSRHINLRRRNRASVWRSRQYFCSTISERLAGSGIHTPRKPMAKIGPKRAKLRVFFRVKHVKGPTFEYHDFWWFLIGCTHVGANPACLEIHPLGEWPGLRELSWCDTFSGWWLSPTPLKNDGVRQLGLLNFTRSWDFVIFRGYWISR